MKLLSRIRLVFTDLDETLLTDEKVVTPRASAAIAGLQQQGVQVVLCTGRAAQATQPIADRLDITHTVCCNGALVRRGSETLIDRTLPPEVTAEMAHFFRRAGITYYVMAPGGFFVSEITPEVEEAARIRGFAPPLLPEGAEFTPAHKVMAPGAAHLYSDVVKHFGQLSHVIYHPDYLEIAPAGVNKAWGAQYLAAHLDVPREQVLALGDALNDVELLAWAGVGVAMGNAMPETKAAADFTTLSNNDDGVAEVLERVLRARRDAGD